MRRKLYWIYALIFVGALFLAYLIYGSINKSNPRSITKSDVYLYASSTKSRKRIPRIIHQTWHNRTIPPHWNTSHHSVIQRNRDDFEFIFWTDKKIHEFVREREPDFYRNVFLNYKLGIQRVDAFRYIALFYYGGIYIDMDIGCARQFNDLLTTIESLDPDADHLAAFPRSVGYGYEIEFMMTTPGHPLFRNFISHLNLFNHYYFLPYYTVLISTGPVYASIQILLFDSNNSAYSVRILHNDIYHDFFVFKVSGFTWIGSDAKVVFYLSSFLPSLWNCTKLIFICLVFVFVYRTRSSLIVFFRCRR